AALAHARAGLDRILAGASPETVDGAAGASEASTMAGGPDHWRIGFRPEPSLFMSGNDPLRILRELESLGELGATCLDDRLPPFSELDPFAAHVAWDLMRRGSAAPGAIEEERGVV